MAKLRGPLLSLRASSQIGKSIVYKDRRRIKQAGAYARPSDPQSSAQLTQREKFGRTVNFYRKRNMDVKTLEAWQRYANYLRKPWSAYQCFMHFNAGWPLAGDYAGTWYVKSENWTPNAKASLEFSNINTLNGFAENIPVYFNYGRSPYSLNYQRPDSIGTGGKCNENFGEFFDLPIFYQVILRTGEPMTGIHEFQP